MKYVYKSIFKDIIKELIDEKHTLGFKYETMEWTFYAAAPQGSEAQAEIALDTSPVPDEAFSCWARPLPITCVLQGWNGAPIRFSSSP